MLRFGVRCSVYSLHVKPPYTLFYFSRGGVNISHASSSKSLGIISFFPNFATLNSYLSESMKGFTPCKLYTSRNVLAILIVCLESIGFQSACSFARYLMALADYKIEARSCHLPHWVYTLENYLMLFSEMPTS